MARSDKYHKARRRIAGNLDWAFFFGLFVFVVAVSMQAALGK